MRASGRVHARASSSLFSVLYKSHCALPNIAASKLRRFQIGLNCDVVVPSIVHGKAKSWI